MCIPSLFTKQNAFNGAIKFGNNEKSKIAKIGEQMKFHVSPRNSEACAVNKLGALKSYDT